MRATPVNQHELAKGVGKGGAAAAPPKDTELASRPVAWLDVGISSPLPARGTIPPQTRRFPAGKRIYLKYDGTLSIKQGEGTAPVEMSITAGCDWALVRNDGVLVLEARLSASTLPNEDNESSHVAMVLSGMADLTELYGLSPGDPQAYENWVKETAPTRREMNVLFSVRFEVSTAAEEGAASRYLNVAKDYRKYVELGRRICIGAGKVVVGTDSTKVDREIGYLKHLTAEIRQLLPGG